MPRLPVECKLNSALILLGENDHRSHKIVIDVEWRIMSTTFEVKVKSCVKH